MVASNYDFVEASQGNLLNLRSDLQFVSPWDLKSELLKKELSPETIAGVFPIIHGTGGEDGTLLSFFKTLGLKVAGFNPFASYIGFDKVLTKLVLSQRGIANTPFSVILSTDVIKNPWPDQTVFVKPARQGSSVGVFKIKNSKDFDSKVKEALLYDSKVLIEPEIKGRELECSVLQVNGQWVASKVGEIVKAGEFYDFEQKYAATSQTTTRIVEDLPPEILQKIRHTAIEVALALEGNGFARVDFFLTPDNQVLVNEINTLPGFTEISMFPQMLMASGFNPEQILTHIVEGF